MAATIDREKATTGILLTIQREQLLKPLQLISSAIDRKQTLPILSSILLQAKDKQLTLTGTDLEIELIQSAPLDTNNKEIDIAIPAKKLHDICKALPPESQLSFTQNRNQMVINSGKSRFVLNLLPAHDFPTVEKTGDDQYHFDINAHLLRDLFEKTYFAMALQDVRYFLNGLLLDIKGSSCTAVATDGHRLASSTTELQQSFSERHQVLIPRKAVLELIKLLNSDEPDDTVSVSVGENYISVTNNEYQFTSKLIDGRFPEYRAIIPKGHTKTAVIDIRQLKDALSRVAILSNEKFRGAWLDFHNDKVVLQANNPDNDEAEEELPINMEGDHVRISCNINYLLDVLSVIRGETVTFYMTDASSTILVASPDHPDDQYVIMPMSL